MKKLLMFILGFVFFPVVLIALGLWAMRNWTDKEKDIYYSAYNAFIGVIDYIQDGVFR